MVRIFAIDKKIKIMEELLKTHPDLFAMFRYLGFDLGVTTTGHYYLHAEAIHTIKTVTEKIEILHKNLDLHGMKPYHTEINTSWAGNHSLTLKFRKL